MAMPKMLDSSHHFLVTAVRRAADCYCERLGLRLIGTFFGEPTEFAMVTRGEAEIHLRRNCDGLRNSNRDRLGDALDCYIRTDDVETLHAEFAAKGADII